MLRQARTSLTHYWRKASRCVLRVDALSVRRRCRPDWRVATLLPKQPSNWAAGDGPLQREIGILTTPRANLDFARKHEHAMGAAMPFSKYDADPDMMEAMRGAFYRVCDILQLSDHEDSLTELVVLKIVELAKAGERDPEILCIDVLAALEALETHLQQCELLSD
jgi:hypothetical protein